MSQKHGPKMGGWVLIRGPWDVAGWVREPGKDPSNFHYGQESQE